MSTLIGGVPFVGREQELATLLAHLEAAGRGRSSIVLLGGEPGIGKTRLMGELAERARDAGWLVLAGRASESEGVPPYLPFTEALRDYVRTRPAEELRALLGPDVAEVALVVREVSRRLPDLQRPPGLAAEHERYYVFEAVVDFLLAIACSAAGLRAESPVLREAPPSHPLSPQSSVLSPGRGLLLCLDDLHWADRPSLLLLQHLVRRLATERAPLLVVGTYRTVDVGRDHPLSDVLADLGREHLCEVLVLPSLSGAEAAALITTLAGTPPAPQVVEAIHRETGGNAFFLSEMVRHLLAEGRNLVSSASLAARWGVPEGVRHVIRMRLSRLSAETNRMLQAGAVLGEGFRLDVLTAVSGIDELSLMDALDEGLSAGMLREDGDRYHFTHALIRQTLYGELNRARRALLHRRALEALERAHESNPAPYLGELAHHAIESGDNAHMARAMTYARRAGDRAMSLLAYEEAARFYRLALRALDLSGEPDEEQRSALLLAQGDAERRAGDLDQAMESFQMAWQVARRADPSGRGRWAGEHMGRAALGFEDVLLARGVARSRPDPAVLMQEETLLVVGEKDSPLRARLLGGLAGALYFGGERERARELSEAAVAMARRLGDRSALVHALNSRRIAIWGPDNLDERLTVATELMQVAAEVGDQEMVLEGRRWRLTVLMEKADIPAADAEIEAYSRQAEALRQPHQWWVARMWQGLRALMDGRYAEADALARELHRLGQHAKSQDAEASFLAQAFIRYRNLGSVRHLEELEPAVRDLAVRFPAVIGWQTALAVLYSQIGRSAEARRIFEELAAEDFAAVPRDWLWLYALANLARVCVSLGDVRRAETLYNLLSPYAGHSTFPDVDPSVAEFLGLLAATMDRREQARRHFEAALAMGTRAGARPAVARIQYNYATMLLAGARPCEDDLRRARELLEQAVSTYTELGVEVRAAEVRELLARSRLDAAPSPVGAYPDRLTEREVEVLRLIAAGRTSREIADELVLSVRTVERHILNVYMKIRARGRAEATAYALRQGLL